MAVAELPAGIQVFERGWLSSNNVLLGGDPRGAVLVDTGYCSHAAQTAALLAEGLRDEPGGLRLIVNTHLHSDHCGGNAHLQQLHGCPIWIPPGDFEAARCWDETALSYRPTGQQCPRFTPAAMLRPGSTFEQAGRLWQVHAAPGHDPHSVLLFEPASRLLISADALWERGFGIVFPEIDGRAAFDELAASLDLIESLRPAMVIPGHGRVFEDVETALQEARSRLDFFRTHPERHARHAAKALIMFHLLEVQRVTVAALHDWLDQTPIHAQMWRRYFGAQAPREWNSALLTELQQAGAIAIGDGVIQAK
jgi:glyoxylase-like metal-dependent hydrolase (beta-lactamase superfamily II)